jgi:hypothetical protein
MHLPLLSTRGRVQIGRRFGLHVQHDPAGELLIDRLLVMAWRADAVDRLNEVAPGALASTSFTP